MRLFIAGATAFSIVGLAVANASLGAANWRAGDALVYDVTVELQQHQVRPHSAKTVSRSAPSPETTTESASSGSMIFEVRSADGRGGARASADLEFTGRSGGRLASMVRTVPAAIDASGRIYLSGLNDAVIGRALDLADAAIADAIAHGSMPGRAWRTTAHLSGAPGTITFSRLIQTAKPYQGYPTIQVLSSGSVDYQGDRQNGKLSIASTAYYDPKDRLLIGAAVRSFELVLDGKGGHVESTVTLNLALREVDRSGARVKRSAAPIASASPAAVPVPTRLPASAVTPIPGATGAPTSTPMNPVALPSTGP